MDVRQSNTNPEYFLVKLFRTCQALYGLMQDERLALLRFDYQGLKSLAESRITCFENIERLARIKDLWQPGCTSAAQPDCPQEDPSDCRQAQLQRGIETLFDVIQDLADGNQGMARSALRRIEAAKTMFIFPDETLISIDPTWQSPILVSILLFFHTQETILQGVLDGNTRLGNIMKTLLAGQEAVKLRVDVVTPMTGS
jgi:hypothetical protein